MKTISKFLSIIFMGLIMVSCKKDDTQGQLITGNLIGEVLLVGANKQNITPSEGLGIKMSGFTGRTDPFTVIHDDLFVRTVVITDQDDNITTIHCSVDQLSFAREHWDEVYARVISEINGLENLPSANLFISATHTHGGPSTVNPLNTEDRNDKVFQSIKLAYENRQEARMRIGVTEALNVNSNRRNPHEGPLGNFTCPYPEVNLEGNSDKDAHFIEFINIQDKSIASMITFGVHSTVMGQYNLQITGDLAGYASRYIEDNLSNGHVSLFLYTGGGDQSPTTRGQQEPRIDHPITGVKAFGDRLGSQVLPQFSNGEFLEDINITSISAPVTLFRDYEVKNNIDGEDGTTQRGIHGIKYAENFAIVATQFELFSETVQELKQGSPFEYTIILSLTNSSSGGYFRHIIHIITQLILMIQMVLTFMSITNVMKIEIHFLHQVQKEYLRLGVANYYWNCIIEKFIIP